MSEDCGRRSLGSSREGCIEAVRNDRSAQADLARGGFQREIPGRTAVAGNVTAIAPIRENEANRRG